MLGKVVPQHVLQEPGGAARTLIASAVVMLRGMNSGALKHPELSLDVSG